MENLIFSEVVLGVKSLRTTAVVHLLPSVCGSGVIGSYLGHNFLKVGHKYIVSFYVFFFFKCF